MSKNVVSDVHSWDVNDTGDGGGFNSNQPLGGSKVLSIDGVGFGGEPTVIIAAKWNEGNIGAEAGLDSPEVGVFDQGSYSTGLLSKYYTMGDSTGVGIREGGTDASVDNRLTGFVKVLPNFTEYLISFDSGVPQGRHFSSMSEPNAMPDISVFKQSWASDQPLDDPDLADFIAMTWSGTSFATGGNQSGVTQYLTNLFDFDVWNGYLHHQKAGADPFLDNGEIESVITIPSHGTITDIKNDSPTFGGGATNPYYNRMSVPAWTGNGDQNLTQHLFRYLYLAVGENSRARLELGDRVSYDDCRFRRVIPHDSWSDTNVTVTTDSKQREGMTHWFITNADGTRQSGEL